MIKSKNKDKNREKFENNGFIIFKNILEENNLKDLREFSDDVLNQQDEKHFKVNHTTGSMAMIDWEMVKKYKVTSYRRRY